MKKPSLFPVLFLGHGTPMNAIEDNEFSRGWQETARDLPKPEAILCISAHWESSGTRVTAMEKPRTIHDFGGFPDELFAVKYPAPGNPALAGQIRKLVKSTDAALDDEWGLDHGCWSVVKQMYPKADVPVVQLSLNADFTPTDHYALGRELAPLRREGVLIIGSGNMVHNLGLVEISGDDFNEPFGFDWAVKANDLFKQLIKEDRHEDLVAFDRLGEAVSLAINTAEHFLPLLYVLALKEKGETVSFFNDKPVGGSLTMTSLLIKK
jgi:4,5-DOPA dioxygenase extradiol